MSTTPDAAARFLDELETSRWAGGIRQGSSAEIFDAGRDGLRFFAAFGPLYARHRGETFDFDRDIRARYDEQREIAFGKLRADAEQLRALSAAMSETSLDFRDAAAPLFGSWEGEAADRARGQVAGMVDSAGSAWARLATLADTIETAVEAAERVTVDKAKAIHALALERIGGLAADEVRLLVDCAEGCTDPQLAELAGLCDLDISPAVCRASPDLLEKVADDVRGWLDHAFVPVYEARLHVFDTACKAAASNLTGTWEELRATLETVAAQPLDLASAMATPTAAPAATEPGSPKAEPQDDDTMSPQAAGPRGVGPAALPVTAPAAGTGGGAVFFGGPPLVGGSAVGGGDREYKRRVPLAGVEFSDPEPPGETDLANYNEDAEPDLDIPEAASTDVRSAVEEILGTEEDLW